jgi:RNA polymerase sigma-70 factor (ECF subfamily)
MTKINSNPIKEELFTNLLEKHKRIIYKIVNSYCNENEDRKDLEQEITIQLWYSFDKYDSNYKYSTWVYRIALNVAISFYRKQKSKQSKFTSLSEDLLFYNSNDEEYNPEIDNKLRLLQDFINQLDELNKALMLLYLDEKKHAEIAEILGLSKTNVATKINRLKIKLSEKLKKTIKHENN